MTRYQKFVRLPRPLRVAVATILFVPSWIAAQPELLRELWSEWKGLTR